MDPVERNRIFWYLALMRVSGIGPVFAQKLIATFGGPKEVFAQDRTALGAVVPHNVVESILNYDPEQDKSLTIELDKIEAENVAILTPQDKQYPKPLKAIFDPPAVLYVKGELRKEDELSIAIVGTRRPTSYGIEQSKRFAEYMVGQGLTVVSGMAMGIDGHAQEAAIGAKGRTIAVLGSGVDVVYPTINANLYKKIIECGAIVSEFPIGTEPARENFPRRNRIISGISLGVLVIEGSADSGSLITAKYALEQGREVFALPGPVDRPSSDAPNLLIRQGATAVFEPGQIIEELGIPELSPEIRRKALDVADGLHGTKKIIYELLGYDGKHIDAIAQEAKMDSQRALATLFELEMMELVKRLPGAFFARKV